MLGLVFAGTRNENAQELLYEFAIYFLNEVSTDLRCLTLQCKLNDWF